MEPVSAIIGALVAGATAAAQSAAGDVVNDAYQGLKTLVVEHWRASKNNDKEPEKAEAEAQMLIENLESDPETFKGPVEKKLANIIDTSADDIKDIMAKIEELQQAFESTGQAGKYSVSVSGGQGVQVGDGTVQNNTFN